MNTKSIAIICATVILIGILFWPTLYRYDKISVGENNNTLLVRINRLTGYTEYFLMGEWIPQEGQSSKKSEILPRDEQIKVDGTAYFNGYGSFCGEVYNGSSWKITDMIIRVIVKEKDGSVRWDRKFKKAEEISPLSTGEFCVKVIQAQNVASFEWGIVEIRGYKED